MKMKNTLGTFTSRFGATLLLLGCASLLGTARAQETSSATTRTHAATTTTEVRSGTVIYVSGNDLVLKLDDGTIKHFVVPNSRTVTVDGKQLTVHDLKPGMTLTRTITTTSTPTTVQTVRTIQGKVWYVNPPKTLILSFPDGPNKEYKVPDGQMFDVDGKKQSIFHVKKGMMISATIVKDSPETVVSTSHDVTGTPAPAPPPTPPAEAVLLFESVPAPAPAPAPAPQVAEATLPKTASPVPLTGLLGVMLLCISAGVLVYRRR
jgi:LPXTG-motif cell wall-anchored protein